MATNPQRKLDQKILILLLAPQGEVLARGPVAESVLPIERGDDALDLTGRESAGVEAAYYRPHARARNRIDRDVLLFQHLQDADMRYSTRSTTGKDQADSRPVGRGWRRRGRGVRDVLSRSRGRSREPENGTKNAEYPETGPDRPW